MKPQIIRHGEVILRPIISLPKEVKFEKKAKSHIVAHSETGHHHVLDSVKNIKVYSWNGRTYLEVPEIGKLWHQKTGTDVHKEHKVMPSLYEVIIKKSFNYFSRAMERVRD